MSRGRRTSLADLAGDAIEDEPIARNETATGAMCVPLNRLVANPHNPRRMIGDVSDLRSIADVQLQPAVVVTGAVFLNLWPGTDLGGADLVVVNGHRRLKAAYTFGRSDLEIVVKDELARDRATLRTASIEENIGREDLDVIDEAYAVEALVKDCGGRADEAAEKLNKSAGWVSQRRALLKLAPELQEKVRAGELAVRLARSLGRVPLEQQVTAWLAAQERGSLRDDELDDHAPRDDNGRATKAASTGRITRALRKFEAEPAGLATALREYLGDDGIKALIVAINEG